MEAGVARLLAPNPSPFTFTGTQTYLVGDEVIAVIDPGPDLPEHVDSILDALDGRELAAILCTHTHRDHSPAARPLAERTGAPVVGCKPLALEALGPRADAAFDDRYQPDRVLEDNDCVQIGDMRLVAVATPGHTSNHLCFALEPHDILFTGDHVMGWSTTVVVPPDGNMRDYMRSLETLRQRGDRVYFPAHGPAITNPLQLVRGLIGHRLQRERQVLQLVGEQPRDIPSIVALAYPMLEASLTPAAGGTVLAHLLDLEERGLVQRHGELWQAVA